MNFTLIDLTVDIATWLGVALSRRDFVEIKKPPFLTTHFFNTLQAGADVVTMSAHCPYIYEVAFKLVELALWQLGEFEHWSIKTSFFLSIGRKTKKRLGEKMRKEEKISIH